VSKYRIDCLVKNEVIFRIEIGKIKQKTEEVQS
jgi:hypothetical protein